MCVVNYERKECVHIFLHEKGLAWVVGGGDACLPFSHPFERRWKPIE